MILTNKRIWILGIVLIILMPLMSADTFIHSQSNGLYPMTSSNLVMSNTTGSLIVSYSSMISYSLNYGINWNEVSVPNAVFFTSVIKSNGHLFEAYYYPTNDYILAKNSTDGGLTWSLATVFMDTAGSIQNPSCAVDKNDIIHCCATTFSDIFYTNTSKYDTELTVDSSEGEWCSIEVDNSSNIIIVGCDATTDDINLYTTADGFTKHLVFSGTSMELTANLHLNVEKDNIYIAFTDNSDLYFCNATSNNFSAFSCKILDSLSSFKPNILSSNSSGDIYILYSDSAVEGTSGNLYYAYSNNYGVNWTVRTSLNKTARGYSFADSNYPSFNNADSVYYYAYQNSGGIYSSAFNLDIVNPNVTIIYPTATNYNINVSFINYTVVDENPLNCWYSNGTSNSTPVSAGINFTNVITSEGSNTYTVYCNDSIGNIGSDSVTFIKDLLYPTYSNLANNGTGVKINGKVKFNVSLQDLGIGLDAFKFAHNQSGSMTNVSTTDISGSSYTASYILNVTLTYPNNICGMFWFNDSFNKINSTILSCFDLSDTAPVFNQSLTTQTIHHNYNLTYDINCSDADSHVVTYFDNTTLFDINDTTGLIFDNPTQNEEGNYSILISCSDSYVNTTESFSYNIINDVPVLVSAFISPVAPIDSDDLICNNGGSSDTEGDSVTLFYNWNNGTDWMNINNINLSAGNTSIGQNFTCKITPFDGFENGTAKTSQIVTIGEGQVSPYINYTNATTALSGITSDSTNPTNNNSWVNLSVTFYDYNPSDLHTAYFCIQDSISNCKSGNYYCKSGNNLSGSELGCNVSISNLTSSSYEYYVFVEDNSSRLSFSVQESFDVNHPPSIPLIVSPSHGQYLPTNFAWINYSSSDIDLDTINYTIYNGTDTSNFSILANIQVNYYNFTSLSDGVYYLKAKTFDSHLYGYDTNSSITNFTIDTTYPFVDITNISNSYLSETIIYNISDLHIDYCTYTLYNSSGDVHNYPANSSLTCSESGSLVVSTLSAGQYNLSMVGHDMAGNTNETSVLFNTSESSTIITIGGGGGGAGKIDCKIATNPITLEFGRINQLQRIVVINNQTSSLDPIISVSDENIAKIRGSINTILPKGEQEISIESISEGTTNLNIGSVECNNIVVPIIVKKEYLASGLSIDGMYNILSTVLFRLSFRMPFTNEMIEFDVYFIYIVGLIAVLLTILAVLSKRWDLGYRIALVPFGTVIISTIVGLLVL